MRYVDNGEPVREGILTVGDTKFDLSENPAPKKELFRPDASWNTKSITYTPAGCSISLVPEKERFDNGTRCIVRVLRNTEKEVKVLVTEKGTGKGIPQVQVNFPISGASKHLTFRMPNWDVKLTIEDHFVGEQY